MIQTLCFLLETLLTADNTPPDTHKDIYELYFVFAAIWAFGGFLFKDEVCVCVCVCVLWIASFSLRSTKNTEKILVLFYILRCMQHHKSCSLHVKATLCTVLPPVAGGL